MRKAQRSKEIKHSHGSDAQISSGTASGLFLAVTEVDELRASSGGKSEARKAQRSIEIKHSRGSDAQISSGTASGFARHTY